MIDNKRIGYNDTVTKYRRETAGIIEGEMIKYIFPIFTGYNPDSEQTNLENDLKQWIMTVIIS